MSKRKLEDDEEAWIRFMLKHHLTGVNKEFLSVMKEAQISLIDELVTFLTNKEWQNSAKIIENCFLEKFKDSPVRLEMNKTRWQNLIASLSQTTKRKADSEELGREKPDMSLDTKRMKKEINFSSKLAHQIRQRLQGYPEMLKGHFGLSDPPKGTPLKPEVELIFLFSFIS
jgi:hypothetical protein